MPRRRRRRLAIFGLLALALCVWWCGRGPALTLGTFNIRLFMDEYTDAGEVAAALAELDVDAVAVQEIRDLEAFGRVVAAAGASAGREYAAALVPYCRKFEDRPIYLGVVYDAARLELVARRRFGGDGTCTEGQPNGMLALLRRRDGGQFAFASVHMKAGGQASDHARRRREWAWLTAAIPGWTTELGAPVIVAGDFNSTGYLQADSEERRFIDRTLADRGLQLPTGALECSEYWEQVPGHYAVSLLDHVLAPEVLTFGAPEVLGVCAALACEPQIFTPEGFLRVSDHCPVRIELVDGV